MGDVAEVSVRREQLLEHIACIEAKEKATLGKLGDGLAVMLVDQRSATGKGRVTGDKKEKQSYQEGAGKDGGCHGGRVEKSYHKMKDEMRPSNRDDDCLCRMDFNVQICN